MQSVSRYRKKESGANWRIYPNRGDLVGIKTGKYERIEATFAKDNEKEMELYNFAKKQSQLFGQAKYIKMLILEDMKKARK